MTRPLNKPCLTAVCAVLLAVCGHLPLTMAATATAAATNDGAVNPSEPRMCYACTGTNCQRPSQTGVQTQCNDVLDFCVTVFEGTAVQAKGCYSELPDTLRRHCDEPDNPECYKCFGQLCNNKGRADLKCIVCSSSDDKKCSTDTSAITPAQCDIPTATNTYCYVRTTAKGAVSRGCLVSQKEQTECSSDGACSLCLPSDGAACNSYTLKTEGGTSAAGSRLWGVCLMPVLVALGVAAAL